MSQSKRKVPMRKCVVSGEMYPKRDLVRIVRNKEREVSIDPTGRINGRGAYIALEPELAVKAKNEKIFDQLLKVDLSEEFYDELIAYIDHQKGRKELFEGQSQ